MANNFEELINAKINQIENELNILKNMILSKKNKPASLRGMAKLLVSEQNIDESIEDAKNSLFKGA